VNTWREQNDTMTVLSMTQRLNKTKYITTIYYKPVTIDEEESAQIFTSAATASAS